MLAAIRRVPLRGRFQTRSIFQKLNKHPYLPEPHAYRQGQPAPDDDVIVAMSSGVDSSVTAAIYAQKHRNVKGVYMANWSQSAKCTEGEWTDVQRVCEKIGISCERVNFEKDYWFLVFLPMIEMYENGLTPNPDLGCNKFIKFGVMMDHLAAKYKNSSSKWWLATGHYARIENDGVSGKLVRAYDGNKDQSYYLANISPSVLSRLLMPLGHYTKPQVREMAKQFDLHIASKPDSQGLCFVSPDHSKFRHFLDEYIPAKPGNIITEDGKVWGQHQGIWHATIGQRLGISMPQGDPKYQGIWFVSEKRKDTNELVIVKGKDNPALYSKTLAVGEWEWLVEDLDFDPELLTIQFRSLQEPVEVSEFSSNGTEAAFTLKEKQRAMAPGQNIVLYQGNTVLGAGVLLQTS